MTENERLTHKCGSGINLGYWTTHKKNELVERLAAYEDTGLLPEEILEAIKKAKEEERARGIKLAAECIGGRT